MSNKKTDKRGYSTVNPDEERDMAAKGGPTSSLGISDDAHDVPHPYDEDTQTQLEAKSAKKKKSGETLNDDWKTGTDKEMTENKSSTNNSMNNDSSMNRNSNYNNKQTTSDTGSMKSNPSKDMDKE